MPTKPVTKPEESVKTETIVESTTGNTIITTNDQVVIKKDLGIKYVTQHILVQEPELIGEEPVEVQTVEIGKTKQITVVFESKEEVKTEVTTIVNTETNKVDVINVQPVKPEETKPAVRVIPVAILPIVEKKFPELKEITTSVKTTLKTEVTFESVTVKELHEVKIYTTVVSTPTGEKVQQVFIYDKNTDKVTPVETVSVPTNVKPTYIETTVNEFQETVIESNDVTLISEEQPDINVVLGTVDQVYGEPLSETVKSVKITEHTYSTEYQIVTEVKGVIQEVTVIKTGDNIDVLGIETVPEVESQPEV